MEHSKKRLQGEGEGDTPGGAMALGPVSSPPVIQANHHSQLARWTSQQTLSTSKEAAAITQARTLMLVNIKQIIDSWCGGKHKTIIINNTAPTSLKIIGKVSAKQVDECKGFFKIDDSTGTIDASIWFTFNRKELDCIPDGAYAMVVGRLKIDSPKPEIQCYVCRAVTNFNDISHHHLSVIATHIDMVFKPEKSVHERVAEMWQEDMKRAATLQAQALPGVLPVCSYRPISAGFPNLSTHRYNNDKPEEKPKMEPMATLELSKGDAVMRILREESSEHGPAGVHIENLCKKLKVHEHDIRPHIDDLALAGELYSTVDADHFAAT